MKTKKKSRFLTFFFSCIPGGGEMYMGFMKTGISLMLLFALTIIVSSWTNQGVLTAFCVVEWFYSFFYANHLASLDDEEFYQVKDTYLFGLDSIPGIKGLVEKHYNLVACGLIFIGACFLWNSVADLLYDLLPNGYRFVARVMWRIGNYVPSLLMGLAVIALGMKMISGKKIVEDSFDKHLKKQETEDKIVDVVYKDEAEQEEK